MEIENNLDVSRYLSEALEDGRPLVLVAGQSLEILPSVDHAVLAALLRHKDIPPGPGGWQRALKAGLTTDDMVWLAERFSRSVPSEAASQIFNVAWSAVFTTSINPGFSHFFTTRGRQPEAVLFRGGFARVSRSQSRPPIHLLFGKAGDPVSEAAAPRTTSELRKRFLHHATDLLSRVSDTATARGLIVVAGFNAEQDWMAVDDLLSALSPHPGSRVLWFGPLDIAASDVATDMISTGLLIVADRDLAHTIDDLVQRGHVRVEGSASPNEPGMVSLAGGALSITPSMRLRVEASASIVDDEWTEAPEFLDDAAAERSFGRFHGDFGGSRNLIEGIVRDFAITRDFEAPLAALVEQRLRKLTKDDEAIILKGQSSTGKSIALARLAVHARRRLQLPVIISTRIPNFADVDAFCTEAERAGGVATIIICDANQPPQRYRELASALQSRGRRVLVIGSSYILESESKNTGNQIEAPAVISPREMTDLSTLLSRFNVTRGISGIKPEDGASILAMLYRNIADGRGRIASSVSGEARSVEYSLRETGARRVKPTRLTPIAEQLIAAGIAIPTTRVFEDDAALAALGQDAPGLLIDYVMVAGRFDCPTPLNLVLRLLGTQALDVSQVFEIFSDLDLFRWKTSSSEGADLLIAPRLRLEAELLCRSRLGDVHREIEKLVDLIKAVRLGVDRDAEKTFLLDLLQKVDKDGPYGDRYKAGFLRFARALTTLRESHKVLDASLMLKECSFRRLAVYSIDGYGGVSMAEGESLNVLDEARDIIENAVRLSEAGEIRANKRTRASLAAERASIYGYLAVQRGRDGDGTGESSWSDYLAAKSASSRALSLHDGYYPMDIALWTAYDVLSESGQFNLRPEQVLELQADLRANLDIADSMSLSSSQRTKYLERKAKVSALVGDRELTEAAISELEALAPEAATYLLARNRATPLFENRSVFGESERNLAGGIARFIEARANEFAAPDSRCLRLLIQMLWLHSTGQEVLATDRGLTPFEQKDVSRLLLAVQALNSHLGDMARSTERYLEAVLSWLASDYQHAMALWKELSHDTEFEDRSRVVRRLHVTDRSGEPVSFRGRVETVRSGDWRVRIDGIAIPIPLLARDFADQDLTHGRELHEFGIAFNYVGPIADPLIRPAMRK